MDRVSRALRERLHSVYDPNPDRELALRVRHPDGLAWRIHDYTLTLTTPDTETAWDVRDYTIGSLADALSADYEIAYRNTALDHLSATILLAGSNDQGSSNGDHLYAHTALIWALLEATGRSYEEGRAAIEAALRQLILPQSTHEWADLFGQIFGIPRWDGELDGPYTARIIEEVKRARSNPVAILKNIKRVTGYDVTVREPWQEIFVLSESPMDDDFHLQGAPIWQYHTAQIVTSGAIQWGPVMREAYADKPAGTIYLDPASHPPHQAIDCSGAYVQAWMEPVHAAQIWMLQPGILSVNLDLSNHDTILNHPFVIYEVVLLWCQPPNDVPLWVNQTYDGLSWNGGWDNRTWQTTNTRIFYPPINTYAGIVMLSGEHAIGDLQCHFAGSRHHEVGDPVTLSDLSPLSDYEYRIDDVPIDEWLEGFVAGGIEWPAALIGSHISEETA